MCLKILEDSRLYVLLLKIDGDLAEGERVAGCACGGALHRANYPRKPRAVARGTLPEGYDRRHSFCCAEDGCRKAEDAGVGPVSRAKSLSRRGRRAGDGAEARGERPPRGGASARDRSESPDVGPVARVVEGDLHRNAVLAHGAGAVGTTGLGGGAAGLPPGTLR